jgi:glycosyltransferase involved in cell wall biosynthesis
VLFVTYHFPPEIGGIQTRIVHYLQGLGSRGVRSFVFVVSSKTSGVPVLDPRVIKVVPCQPGAKHLVQNAAGVLRTINSSRVDVVHVLTGSSTLLGLYTILLGRAMGLRASVSFFGQEDFAQTSILGRVLLLLSASLATSISTNSKATSNLLPQSLRIKSTILLGGADVPQMPRGVGEGRMSVLFVGRLVRRKGVDDLLRAMALVKPEVGSARLVIVGDGPERDALTRLANDLGLSASVEFKGELRGSSLDLEYSLCRMCVLPSKRVSDDPANEGLGLTLVEASMHGKPLVGTEHGGIPEVINSGVNGFLVPEHDPPMLADAILKLLRDEKLAERMGANALEIARDRFTWDAATERLLESYANVR